MALEIISIKELHGNLKKISDSVAEKGTEYLVIRNSKPIFQIIPLQKNAKKKYSIKDLKSLRFSSKNPNLSKDIDKFLY